jgi:Ca-activated chloride channel family protein
LASRLPHRGDASCAACCAPRLRFSLLSLFLVMFWPAVSRAQISAPIVPPPLPADAVDESHVIRRDVDMVLVSATVTDTYERLVTGLDQSNFRVFEDGTEQEIVHFASEDVPISIGIIFDMSGSMVDKFDKSKKAAVEFMKTSNPQDEFFLVNFNDHARLITPFTNRVEDMQDGLIFTAAHGTTALFDGIYLGLSEMHGARNTRRALLIISDGGDNHSRYSEADIRKFVQEADVEVYAIGLFEPNGEAPTPEEKEGPELLANLTALTGGRAFTVDRLDELPDTASKISMELRNQYVLGYRPSNRNRDGKYRRVKIKLAPPRGLPPLHVEAKNGYLAPGH